MGFAGRNVYGATIRFVSHGESSRLVCLLGSGLENLAILFNNLVWLAVRQIIQFFIVTRCIYLVIYVDDIVLIGSDHYGIGHVKEHLLHHFQTKNIFKLNYFYGIELDILKDTGLMNSKSVDTPMDPSTNLYLITGVCLRSWEVQKISWKIKTILMLFVLTFLM